MKKTSLLSLLFLAAGIGSAQAQELKFSKAKFHVGDNMEWGKLSTDDSQWRTLSVLSTWSGQGVSNPNNYAWYRIKFVLPESMRTAGDVKNVLRFDMGMKAHNPASGQERWPLVNPRFSRDAEFDFSVGDPF